MTSGITINPEYILAVMYIIGKVATSIWICKHEFQYPVWNKSGMPYNRGIHHKAQSFLRNLLINPEWGLIKAIAFLPVFLATGKRFIHSFLPWRVQNTPPFCQQCKDKGKYRVESFMVGKSDWKICGCQKDSEPAAPSFSCHICQDKGTIGKKRRCPHCERRGIIVHHAQDQMKKRGKNLDRCGGCRNEHEVETMNLVGARWFCSECIVHRQALCPTCGEEFTVRRGVHKWCEKCYPEWYKWLHDLCCRKCGNVLEGGKCRTCYTNSSISSKAVLLPLRNEVEKDSYRYLNKREPAFCGALNEVQVCQDLRHVPSHLQVKEPIELSLGDTITIRSIQRGHRHQDVCELGKPLEVLGINLPFMVIGYSTDMLVRQVEVVDLRGVEILGRRSDTSEPTNSYQPLLDPSALEVGDKFMLLELKEDGEDGSWRGITFRVTKSAFLSKQSGKMIIAAAPLTGLHAGSDRPMHFCCEGLLILPVNDQYIRASNKC